MLLKPVPECGARPKSRLTGNMLDRQCGRFKQFLGAPYARVQNPFRWRQADLFIKAAV